MNDRELLQAAAKVAGYESVRWGDDYPGGLLLAGEQETWNPLTDDGDALRLAVKLNLAIFPDDYPKADKPYVLVEASDPDQRPTHASEFHGSDRYAATRRAIVRAAAEIGVLVIKIEGDKQ
jgi:hypothetical protein